MNEQELVSRAMKGEVVGNGVDQVAALVAELRRRPKAIVMDMNNRRHDDEFGSLVPRRMALIEPAKPVSIVIESENRRWKFEQAITTETPTVECDVTYESHAGDANATIVIHQMTRK